ncbi:MAG: hypothetical protein ACRDZ5_02410 [Acidimicrobiales bacterium]
MRGARITIKCDCGTVGYVSYGESFACQSCSRRWSTSQIPAGEYWGIMREMRRFRLVATGMAVVICAFFALLVFYVQEKVVLLFPVIFAGWYLLYMPRWRRRVRRRARDLPTWQIRPE